MLSRRPSNGLYTYNFELDRLRITTLDSASSLTLDERDYTTKLILTLRQFRDAPRKAAKRVESGYLFILHSGTNAIERLDLRKVRQSTSDGAAPTYRIRAEGCGIGFQYLCSDSNIRRINIGFRKQDEYERALQILLSQGLSVIIKKPEHSSLGGLPFVPTVSRSPQPGLPISSFPVRQNTVPHVPRAWAVPPTEPSYFPSREGRTLSIPMPPLAPHNVRSNTRLGAAPGYYHSGGHYSPAFAASGYCTPTQSQSQLSEEAFPGFGWPPSQQPGPSFDPASSREDFQLGRIPGPSSTTASRAPFGATRYGTPQSFMSSQSCRDPSLPERDVFSQAAQQHYNHGDGVNVLPPTTNVNSDFMLPPTRTLPFKSKKMKLDPQSTKLTSRERERPWNVDENIKLGGETQRSTPYKPTMPGEGHAKVKGLPRVTRQGEGAGTMVLSETPNAATQETSHFGTNQGHAIDKTKRRLGIPRLPTKDAQLRADNTSRAADVGESPSGMDTELLNIFHTLDDTVERWRMGLHGDSNTDLKEVLSNLQSTTQRLHVYLHPSHLESGDDQRNDSHFGAQTEAEDNQMMDQSASAMMEEHRAPERRHTKEYKRWKDYYLFACRLYETKEERTDPEFIHRFLRGMPGKRALRWVQMGLLHCYPSMVRLSDRRSGTTIVFTKDLRWSHVCEMVTRKLKLPFPKWETARVS